MKQFAAQSLKCFSHGPMKSDAGFGTEIECSMENMQNSMPSFSKQQQTTKNGLGDLINGMNNMMNPGWKCSKITTSKYYITNKYLFFFLQYFCILYIQDNGTDLVARNCAPNVAGLLKDGCMEGTPGPGQGSMTIKNCYCSTDLCNSSNSIGILNISFFSCLALFYIMN